MNKIALVTANIGDFDWVRRHVQQDADYIDRYITITYPFAGLNNRMKAKYWKIMTHEEMSNELICWVDASMWIKTQAFLYYMETELGDNDVLIMTHPKRPNPYEELLFIRDHVKIDPYLKSRYDQGAIEYEICWLRAHNMPENYPLYACGCFLRKNSDRVNAAFNEWWSLCVRFSEMDQALFSFICWKHGLKVKGMSYNMIMEDFVEKREHR